MIEKKAFVPFIVTGVFVALPTLAVVFLIDSLHYGQFTIAAFNFFWINVGRNLSAEFGVHRTLSYFDDFLPEALGWQCLLLAIAVYHYAVTSWRKGQIPYILIYTIMHLGYLTGVGHKESRYMMPAFPYFFMMIGDLIAKQMRRFKHLDKAAFVFLILMPVYQVFHHKAWSLVCRPLHLPAEHIMAHDPNPHSIYPAGIHNTNVHSLTHIARNSTFKRPKIHRVLLSNPPFFKRTIDVPVQY